MGNCFVSAFRTHQQPCGHAAIVESNDVQQYVLRHIGVEYPSGKLEDAVIGMLLKIVRLASPPLAAPFALISQLSQMAWKSMRDAGITRRGGFLAICGMLIGVEGGAKLSERASACSQSSAENSDG